MRETSILYNKNYKMQAHARVCEERVQYLEYVTKGHIATHTILF